MAPTFRHGKGAYFSLTSTAGVTIVLSSGGDDMSLDSSADTAEVTAFGDDDRVYIAGLRGHTFSLSGHFASTYADPIRGMLGNSTASNCIFGAYGNTTGFIKSTFAMHLTQFTVGSPVGDKVSMSISAQVTGAVSSTIF